MCLLRWLVFLNIKYALSNKSIYRRMDSITFESLPTFLADESEITKHTVKDYLVSFTSIHLLWMIKISRITQLAWISQIHELSIIIMTYIGCPKLKKRYKNLWIYKYAYSLPFHHTNSSILTLYCWSSHSLPQH